MTPTTRPRALLSVVLALGLLVLVGCGGSSSESSGGGSGGEQAAGGEAPRGQAIARDPANERIRLTIGSKDFTEQKVLGEIYVQALRAKGYTVQPELNLGSERIAYASLREGQIDAYPEYVGTALTSFFDVETDAIPKDTRRAFDQVRGEFAGQGITALPPTPFTNSNEVGVTRETAQRLRLRKISDLARVQEDFTLSGSPECRQRTDCLAGLEQAYGLRELRENYVPVDVDLRHQVLENGQADGSILFGTDPQIQREGFVLLEDDKNLFPPYNVTFAVDEETARRAGPGLTETIQAVNAPLDERVMQELGARVDLDKQTPKQAATDYLRQFGFVAAS